jgi:hypothetical protein
MSQDQRSIKFEDSHTTVTMGGQLLGRGAVGILVGGVEGGAVHVFLIDDHENLRRRIEFISPSAASFDELAKQFRVAADKLREHPTEAPSAS